MLFQLRNLQKQFKGSPTVVFTNLNMVIEENTRICLIGKSGIGKSTLINILGLLDRNYEGECIYQDSDYQYLSNKDKDSISKNDFGFIYQDFQLLENKTVFDNVALPLIYSNEKKKDIQAKVHTILEQLDILAYSKIKVKKLSGGERQRVAIARALVKNPKVIFADEITSSLDDETTKSLMSLLNKITENKTLIFVSHDNRILSYFDEVVDFTELLDNR